MTSRTLSRADGEIYFLFGVQEKREEPPPNGAFTKARSPRGGIFSYPGLRLRRAKSALSAGGSASCLFSSQAPYPYLFLGWHNKERECQETTHTPPLLEGSGSSGSPYRRKDLTSLNRHYYLSAPTTRPSSARRARPWPLLVSSS
ncbi:unnamed protein product [Prunus armeniaca]|uniref:Uncharacterized protein n=1 Tax=Prunus armeniaca TaxID=36596 RepID=A0A6J5WM24_PRUAR|nr:unnamed protein product [Prunus armeniaca]